MRSERHLGNGSSYLVVIFVVAIVPLCYYEVGREVECFLELEGGVHIIVYRIRSLIEAVKAPCNPI